MVESSDIFDRREARIMTMNHSSQLDFFLMAAIMPPGGTPLLKRELVWAPILGWAIVLLDILTIDRKNPVRARRTLDRARRRLQVDQGTIMLSPEGTRSRTGRLGPFKMGTFHLAEQVEAPIVPVVVLGAATCQPMGSWLVRPGTVTVRVLETVGTQNLDSSNMHAFRDDLRRRYLAALDQLDDESVSNALGVASESMQSQDIERQEDVDDHRD